MSKLRLLLYIPAILLLVFIGLVSFRVYQSSSLPQPCRDASNAQTEQEKIALYAQCISTGELDESELAKTYFDLCINRVYIGQSAQAFEDCSEAIRYDPSAFRAYILRGSLYAEQGMDQEAISDFSKAIELKPKVAISYYGRAEAHYELEQFELAVVDYKRSIELDPTYALAYEGLGAVYVRQQKLELAVQTFSKAIKRDPKKGEFYHNRGITFIRLSQFEEAVEDFTKAIELSPAFMEAYVARGRALEFLDRTEAALENYSHVIAEAPQFAVVYEARADLFIKHSDCRAALKDLEMHSRLVNDNVSTLNAIAWIYATSSNRQCVDGKRAVHFANKAYKILNTPHIKDTLAAAYARAGNYTEAIRNQMEALDGLVELGEEVELLEDARIRLELYRKSLPYTDETM